MFKQEELEKWFEDLRKIIFDTKVSIDNIKRMAHPLNDFEVQVIKHGFFYNFFRQSRFVIIVQLCKLFGDNKNQRINIHKLFNRLTTDKYDDKLQKRLDENNPEKGLFKNRAEILKEVDLLKSEIAAENSLIKRVVDLRNKFYAHSDPNSILSTVTNEELESLVNLAIKTYNSIHGKIFDVTFLFSHNQDWSVNYPITTLAANRKEQLEKLKQKRALDEKL